jgi:glycine betaine/choline ABC-type transport system substrate-binding protein
MKHKIIAGAAAVALALTLTACGGSSSDSSGDGTVASSFIFGGPAEFKTRTDGIPGLAKNYDVSFGKYTVTDTGGPVTVNALKQGQIDAADLFTTDPSIESNGFVILTDPKANFAAQNVLPIIGKDKATDGVKTTLNAISAKLDTAGLGALMVKVVTEKQDPKDVAKAWLSEQGLDTSGSAASGVKLTVGSANFPENVLLAQMYAEALKAQGADIKLKLNIGSREKYVPALKDGSVDLMPEYNGSILQYLDAKATATEPADVLAALQKALPSNLIVLDQAEAQDSDAIVVTKETAAKYGLKSIADLAKKKK